MTVSDAMIAISAERATLWPKVGPIDSVVGWSAKPNSFLTASCAALTLSGPEPEEIWTRF